MRSLVYAPRLARKDKRHVVQRRHERSIRRQTRRRTPSDAAQRRAFPVKGGRGDALSFKSTLPESDCKARID